MIEILMSYCTVALITWRSVTNPFVTIPILAIIVVAALVTKPFKKEKMKETLRAFSAFFFPVIIMVIGGVFWKDIYPVSVDNWASWILLGFFCLQILYSVELIIKAKQTRWFSLSLILLQLWISLMASFIAGMAISGTWL